MASGGVRDTQKDHKSKTKEKGLRTLANRAFLIVKEMGESTYKQVAIRLIKETQNEESDQNDDVRVSLFRKKRKTISKGEFTMLSMFLLLWVFFIKEEETLSMKRIRANKVLQTKEAQSSSKSLDS